MSRFKLLVAGLAMLLLGATACTSAPTPVSGDASLRAVCRSSGYEKAVGDVTYNKPVKPPFRISGPNSSGKYSVSYRVPGSTVANYAQIPPPSNYWGDMVRAHVRNWERGIYSSDDYTVFARVACQKAGKGYTVVTGIYVANEIAD